MTKRTAEQEHRLDRELTDLIAQLAMGNTGHDHAVLARLLGEAIRAHPNGAILLDYIHHLGQGRTGDAALFHQRVLAAASQ